MADQQISFQPLFLELQDTNYRRDLPSMYYQTPTLLNLHPDRLYCVSQPSLLEIKAVQA
jgi:hypothetical protein